MPILSPCILTSQCYNGIINFHLLYMYLFIPRVLPPILTIPTATTSIHLSAVMNYCNCIIIILGIVTFSRSIHRHHVVRFQQMNLSSPPTASMMFHFVLVSPETIRWLRGKNVCRKQRRSLVDVRQDKFSLMHTTHLEVSTFNTDHHNHLLNRCT